MKLQNQVSVVRINHEEYRLEAYEHTLAFYHFDEGEGEVLKDSSGNGHHGKIYGATWVNADGSPIEKKP